MPPQRAQLGGVFGSGMYQRPDNGIDIGGAIDALTGGAAGLIHQAYLRRQAEHQIKREDAQLDLERQREDRQAEHERRMAMAQGVVPASTSVEREAPRAAPAPTMPSIGDAFARGLEPAPAAPSSLTTPVTDGSLGTIPRVRVTSTPEHYDPEYDRTRVRTLDAIGARGAQTSALEDKKQAGRVDLAAARHTYKLEEQADAAAATASRASTHDDRADARSRDHDNRVAARGTGGGGGSRGTLTANGKEVAKRTFLDGLVGYHGDEAKVRDYLTADDVGKSSAEKYGITDADIAAAVGRAVNHATDQTVRLSGAGRKPEKAAGMVRAARAAVQGKGSAPGLPPLSQAEKDRAAADPEYRAFKESKGYKF